MRRQLTITCTLTAIVLMLLAGPAVAAPLYNLKTDPSGIPYILHSTAGYAGFGYGGFNGISAMTVDGNPYVALGQQYSSVVLHAGEAYQSLNNSATPTEAGSSYITHYGTGPGTSSTVCDGQYDKAWATPEVVFKDNELCHQGMTRPFAEGRFFGSAYFSDVADIQLEALGGAPDATSNAAGLRSQTAVNVDGSSYKNGLALYGQAGSADTWNLLVGSIVGGYPPSPTATLVRLRKVEMGALTGLTPDYRGTRGYTQGGWLTDGSDSEVDLFANLVPGVADSVVDFAINPTDGNLYFLSIDETNDKAYLSAVSLTGGWGDLADDVVCTYVDLDPETADKYLDITYDNSTDPTLASYARGLGFSEDGTVLFIARNAGDGDPARVFIMDLIPEPATMGLLGLGFAGMAVLRRRRRNAS